MRISFFEDSLPAGKDIFLIANAAGHDEKTPMSHYERIDPRKRSRKTTEFEMGKNTSFQKVSNLKQIDPRDITSATVFGHVPIVDRWTRERMQPFRTKRFTSTE